MPVVQLLAAGSPKGKENKALATSMVTLSHNVNAMVVQMGAKPCEDKDAKPAFDGKMGVNAKTHKFLTNPKK